MSQVRPEFIKRVSLAHEALGLSVDILKQGVSGRSKQPLCEEAAELVSVGDDVFGRPQRLAPAAARAWSRLLEAATKDNVSLQLVSAFRGVEYQRQLIERKLAAGQALDTILTLSAAPASANTIPVMPLMSLPQEARHSRKNLRALSALPGCNSMPRVSVFR